MVRILVLGGLRVCADAERRVREELLEVGGGMSVDALVGEEGDLEFNPECDREPVKGFEDGGDVFTPIRICAPSNPDGGDCAPSSGSWQHCFVCAGASGCS